MKLTDREIKAAKPRKKQYKMTDGHGLYLLVTDAGNKHWKYRYLSPVTKKDRTMGLGSYPVVPLKEARDNASLGV